LKQVYPVESLGWIGDALEAQAFAFMAVRSLKRLPISLPTTTGARKAVTGGAHYRA
jgi:anhydro-N-acetylmuramic acid kinase